MASGIVGEYLALKEDSEADLLAMQMGDFYEFFGEDAVTVGEELDLKVSERSAGGETYEMAGVPVDDVTPYLTALVERGYRVAVADQRDEDGDTTRELTRLVTPGTLLETDDEDAQYLAAVVESGGRGDEYGLAFCDVTTGAFRTTAVSGTDAVGRALTELYRFAPVEILPGPEVRTDDDLLGRLRERVDARLTLHDTEAFAPGRARHALREQFGDAVDTVGLESDAAVAAAGAVVDYVAETGVGALASITRLQAYAPDDHVALDATTQRNLELTETMTGQGRSLFETVDHTGTSAGGRLLREWLTRPLRQRGELRRRQSAVAALADDALVREGLRELLADAYDLERVASRAVSGSADADALLRARETLALVPELAERIDGSPRLADSPVTDLLADLDSEGIAAIREELAALADDPPKTLHEGGLIERGYDDELDDLVERHEAAVEWFETLAEREKREHGLSHVTVDRNKTDGYYVQVGKSAADGVPDHYENVKTLKSSERYVFDELREKEREVLRLEEERGDREYEAFRRLRESVADRAELLQRVGRTLAELDVFCSLATHAAKQGWTRPELTDERVLDVTAGRHPVVETDVEFVPNDLLLDGAAAAGQERGAGGHAADDRRFLLVTGPNMSGKSTYMRQAALITLLAQVGSFVPADDATVGLVDAIYTRVGALDELAQGRSTFMVEMQELSNILHSATEDSLVVLDEVGRGTATYDGISIAWAATEYVANSVGARTLFATHYHELTQLADELPGVANVHVAAEERDGEVTFLRTVEEGPTDRSYGVHVADLAGVPDPVVDRARDVLDRLREDKALDVRGGSGGTKQAVFDLGSGQFRGTASSDGGEKEPLDPATESVLEELHDTDVNEVPPVELLSRVQEWQRRLDE
ncbi:DNA mismatch repair protein MutS [Natronomonas salina]|uniref:DNA mismatch repair protein MutS n=1 Tax=Natronomonas salina TaxID=1710540 RepID=UPI0015B6B347|nr:DNA mismatch repair protein MutS [Natronomonas salina]QLD89961.1 DNA mismatch repair protein MutS [Natronomonas salina]